MRTYMDEVVADCEKKGYVTTLMNRRREIQMNYNKQHGIVPKTIIKGVRRIWFGNPSLNRSA